MDTWSNTTWVFEFSLRNTHTQATGGKPGAVSRSVHNTTTQPESEMHLPRQLYETSRSVVCMMAVFVQVYRFSR